MLPPIEALKSALEELLPGLSLTIEGTSLVVSTADLIAVGKCLKENERFHLDYLANLTAIDYLPAAPGGMAQAGPPEGRIEVVYHLYSMEKKHGPVTLRVKLPRANPVAPSVTPIWRGAEFQEREVYDLYGVTFEGHPDLRRILMWDGFDGHPMRKDYKPEDQNVLEERS